MPGSELAAVPGGLETGVRLTVSLLAFFDFYENSDELG